MRRSWDCCTNSGAGCAASFRSDALTGVVDVGGEAFHRDPAAREGRDSLLGVPVLHLDAAERDTTLEYDTMEPPNLPNTNCIQA